MNTPGVQNNNCVLEDEHPSRQTEYPTDCPADSLRFDATHSATDMALIRRGWVIMILHVGPMRGSSRRNSGVLIFFLIILAPHTDS